MTHQDEFEIATGGRGTYELGSDVQAAVTRSGVRAGLASVFIQHTSASLMICENADDQVLRDLEQFMQRVVPDGDPLFRHIAEGPDDMPAHVRSVLTQTNITVPVRAGVLCLGTWQGIYLWEHRLRPHRRRVLVTIVGEA